MADLLLLGDSLTDNVPGLSYPPYLWPLVSRYRFLGLRGVEPAYHEGVGGTSWTWIDTLGPLPAGPAVRWCMAHGTPSVVVFLYGTNDLIGVTIPTIPAVVAAIMAHAAAAVGAWERLGCKCYVCHVPGPCDVDAAYVAKGQDRATWEAAVAALNAALDAVFARTIPLPTSPGDWGVGDCYHLAAAGYDHIATEIAAVLGA